MIIKYYLFILIFIIIIFFIINILCKKYKKTINLSERLHIDKELLSGEWHLYENTMNLSESLRVDKELLSE